MKLDAEGDRRHAACQRERLQASVQAFVQGPTGAGVECVTGRCARMGGHLLKKLGCSASGLLWCDVRAGDRDLAEGENLDGVASFVSDFMRGNGQRP